VAWLNPRSTGVAGGLDSLREHQGGPVAWMSPREHRGGLVAWMSPREHRGLDEWLR
jgi:hypothetical protein